MHQTGQFEYSMSSETFESIVYEDPAFPGKQGHIPMQSVVYWSGGATPAHGMSAKRVERVALGRLVLRACVRACVSHTPKRCPNGIKIIQIPSKIDQHSIKHQPTNDPKSSKHRSKIHQTSTKNLFGRVWAPKSDSGRVLAGSWARLVGHKTPICPQLGTQDGAKNEQTIMKNGVQNQSNVRCLLESVFSSI